MRLTQDLLSSIPRSLWPSNKGFASQPMLLYFLTSLDVRTKLIEGKIGTDQAKGSVLREIKERLSELYASTPDEADAAWTQAYRLERLLCLIVPSEDLVGELRARLDEADEESVRSASRLRCAFDNLAHHYVQAEGSLKEGGEAALRSHLLYVMEEIQWRLKEKFTSRRIRKTATYRVAFLAVLSCLCFSLPYVLAYFLLPGHQAFLETWSGLPLWTALTAGLFGAFFSRLLYLQGNWKILTIDELYDARSFPSIVLRGIVGTTAAIVLFFFLHSHVMEGSVFPKLGQLGLDYATHPDPAGQAISLPLIAPNSQLALLFVWSFLAGFSERLVPSILQSTEASLQAATRKPG